MIYRYYVHIIVQYTTYDHTFLCEVTVVLIFDFLS
jgi:hypothetical protein